LQVNNHEDLVDLSLFNEAEKNIFDLMRTDSYPRFLRSHLYEKYCLSSSGISLKVLSETKDEEKDQDQSDDSLI